MRQANMVTGLVAVGFAGFLPLHAAWASQTGKGGEILAGVETRSEDIISSKGLRQRVLVTRPQDAVRRLPAVLALPWMDCDSMAIPAEKLHGFQVLLKHLVEKSGTVLMRVEKPGVGGSEGVCADTDFETELAGFRAALQALRTHPWVDPERIVLLGMSYSGGILPIVADGTPVRGYVVVNSWSRTWIERLLEFERKRMLQQNTAPQTLAARMRAFSELYGRYLNSSLTPADVLKERPALATVWEGPGTHQYGRPAAFFQQLQALNLEHAWSQVRVPTVAIWGEADTAMHRADHERIVELVNQGAPNTARLVVVPRMNHVLFTDGAFARQVTDALDEWLRKVWS